MRTQSILVINSKGGSGKTTVATNLASYFARECFRTALVDYDPQGSSTHWLKTRPHTANPIHGASAAKAKYGSLRSWRMHVPDHIEKIIIDAPAGAGNDGFLMQEMCRRADEIVIPVSPSSMDVHATADFIKDLMLMGKIRQKKINLCVIANRVRKNMPFYKPLERFLKSLDIPFVAQLSDTDIYVRAAEKGIGIYDINPAQVSHALKEFCPILEWLDNPICKDTHKRLISPYSWKPINNVIDFPLDNPVAALRTV